MPYVVRKEIVAQCLARLRERKTHTSFAGYLCLQWHAARLQRLADLQPEFLPFFKQFFLVEGHPLGAPYVKPFTEQKPSDKNLWLNENVAGSYAPSSVRTEQPFRRVVAIQGKTYSLHRDHARLALEHLLYSVPVQVMDLAVFLYRDYGLLGDSVHDLIDVFAYELGYAADPGGEPNDDFKTLFSLPSPEDWDKSWLDPHE